MAVKGRFMPVEAWEFQTDFLRARYGTHKSGFSPRGVVEGNGNEEWFLERAKYRFDEAEGSPLGPDSCHEVAFPGCPLKFSFAIDAGCAGGSKRD